MNRKILLYDKGNAAIAGTKWRTIIAIVVLMMLIPSNFHFL
jgi:hypothetical protein